LLVTNSTLAFLCASEQRRGPERKPLLGEPTGGTNGEKADNAQRKNESGHYKERKETKKTKKTIA
jgi:hypothetical protein